MLQRIPHENGVVSYQSPRLREIGVLHAFSTRLGGISTGPYASLNLGPLAKGDGDDANTSIAENFRRLRRALGCPRLPRVEVKQVHSNQVWLPDDRLMKPREAPCADAIATDQPRRLLTIRVADCVPVLLSDESGQVVAAAHAGWRGLVAGVLEQTIQAMRRRWGVAPHRLVAAIGPHIRTEHFEVGPEVAQAFEEAGLGQAVRHSDQGKPRIDLQQAALIQLQHAGVLVNAIDTTDRCTYRDAQEFFSHRRDAGRTGRMAAVIAVKDRGQTVGGRG